MTLQSHPRWGEIKSEILNPARTIGWRELAEKYDLRDSKGNLIVLPLVDYWAKMTAKFPDLMQTAKESMKDFLRTRVIQMQEKIYNTAMEGVEAAMSRTEFKPNERGNRVPVKSPNFMAAKAMLDTAQATAANLGDMVRPDPQPQGNTFINPVFGNQRTQVISMPKLESARRPVAVLEGKVG